MENEKRKLVTTLTIIFYIKFAYLSFCAFHQSVCQVRSDIFLVVIIIERFALSMNLCYVFSQPSSVQFGLYKHSDPWVTSLLSYLMCLLCFSSLFSALRHVSTLIFSTPSASIYSPDLKKIYICRGISKCI